MLRRNFDVTMDSKSFEYKGNLKLKVKGLHAICNGDHKATEQSQSMPAYSELHVGSLDVTFHAEGDMKGLLGLAATAKEIKKCGLSIGTDANPFSGKDNIYATIDCSEVSLKESGVKARHTFHENGKGWHENIDSYNNKVMLDEFGMEGTLSDIGDVFLQIIGSINDERSNDDDKAINVDRRRE